MAGWFRQGWLCAFFTAFAVCAGDVALAQTPDEALFLRRDDLRIVPFASVDSGRSIFVTLGLKQSLTGPLDRQGFVAMESFGYGLTRERGDFDQGISVVRHTVQTASLVGYQFTFGRAFLSAFVGPELSYEQVTINGVIERWSEPRVGARVQGEVWAQPTDMTLLTASVVAGSTQGSIWSRVSAGLRVFQNLYVGPEATIYTTSSYREWRIGGHVTGASVGRVDLRVSAGVQGQDDEHGASPYIGLAGYFRM